LQEILEQQKIPFVGSGSKASRLGMNKVATKQAWEAAICRRRRGTIDRAGAVATAVSAPCVVKAVASGSSIDVYICKTPEQLNAACETILKRNDRHWSKNSFRGPN